VLEKLKLEAEADGSHAKIRRIDLYDRSTPNMRSDQPLCLGDRASINDVVGFEAHGSTPRTRDYAKMSAPSPAMGTFLHSERFSEANMAKLDGKVAIVTGAARGLGHAYAKRLAGLGAKVAVADLNLHSYEEFETGAKDMTADSTVAEIQASGGTALGIEMDVRDQAAVEAMVARVVQEWGRVDVLVANAGGGRGRPMDTKASSLGCQRRRENASMGRSKTASRMDAKCPHGRAFAARQTG
jgi:hypothetical protein